MKTGTEKQYWFITFQCRPKLGLDIGTDFTISRLNEKNDFKYYQNRFGRLIYKTVNQ